MTYAEIDWLFDNLLFLYYPISFFFLVCSCFVSGIIPGYTATVSDRMHFLLLVVMIIFMRIPSIGFNQELNPDESQMMAQALTLSQKPIFWDSVDGTTSGPLNSYVLVLPYFLGILTDYSVARIVGLGLILTAFYFFYRSLQLISSRPVTRLSTLAVAVFFAWTTWSDFLCFSSELTVLPILTACFYLACLWITGTKKSLFLLFLMGFLAGLAPFCKLQALPVIAGPLIIMAFYLIHAPDYKALLVLISGGVSCIVGILGLCAWYNVLDDFYTYYLLANLIGYEELTRQSGMVNTDVWDRLLALPTYFAHHLDILPLIVLIFAAMIMRFLGVVSGRPNPSSHRWVIALTLMTLGLSLFAVLKPETQFSHYLLFTVFPFGWLLSICLSTVLKNNYAPENRPPIQLFISILFLSIFLRFVLYGYFNTYSTVLNTYPPMSDLGMFKNKSAAFNINPYLTLFPRYVQVQKSNISVWIAQTTQPTDCIAVWGWNSRFYFESQRRQGVTEIHTQRSIMKSSFQEVYREKYLRNLRENQPILFLDAVGPKSFMFTRKSQRHESFPALHQFIGKHYLFVKETEHIRIYQRK